MKTNGEILPSHPAICGVTPESREVESQNKMNVLKFGGAAVNLGSGEVSFSDGCRFKISRRERELLSHLSRKRGTCVSRDEILTEVWQLNPQRVITRTIDMHISKLRHKLRDDARNPSVLKTVNGRGYMVA
jgi:DNA-binding response OmpR family regulator